MPKALIQIAVRPSVPVSIGLIVGLAFSVVASPASAIQVLQLYIEGGTYESGTDTWVLTTTSSPFTLWVMGNVAGPGGKGAITSVYLFAAFPDSVPVAASLTLVGTNASLFGWPDPSTPTNPIAGVRVTDGSTPPGLGGPHGVYGVGTDWVPFPLGTFALSDSPVADLSPGCNPVIVASCAPAPNKGQINAYIVSASGFQAGTPIHFDAAGTVFKGSKPQTVFAPFSHDSQQVGAPIPEPASLLLLGSGLAGLGAWRRRRLGTPLHADRASPSP